MAFKRGAITITTTGTKTLTTTFTPIGYRVTVTSAAGGSDGVARMCTGGSDGTSQTCNWIYADSTIEDDGRSSSKVILHKYNNAGTLADDMVATHSSFSATGPVINVTTLGTSFVVDYEAWS